MLKRKPPDDGADDAEHDIHHQAFARTIDNLGADETGDKAHDEPGKNRHLKPRCLLNSPRVAGYASQTVQEDCGSTQA